MREEVGPVENVRRAVREPGHHHCVQRLLIVRPQDGADGGAAGSELEDLPGVVSVTLNTITGSFDILFDPAVVSDDELAAALHHQGYDLTVSHTAANGRCVQCCATSSRLLTVETA
jgi:hypothetical protein